VKHRHEKGVALITTVLILLLLSTMIAGFAWMVMGDRKLGGAYADRQRAFYGAEAGMETLTASLENLFNQNYAPTAAMITGSSGIVATAPANLINGVQYLNPDGSNGYVISFPTASNGNPQSSSNNITNGTYAGMSGLMTPYTITVTARTAMGSEVRLQRDVQTVAIPVFQFGVFSINDLDYFAEPNFNFGGRVHSNGNIWLGELEPNTLKLGGAVTAGGQIITANLENGLATSGIFDGPIQITTGGAGYANLLSQSPAQSVSGASNYVGHIGAYTSTFATMASGTYGKANLAVSQTGGKVLNIGIATPQIGGQEIDMIRRPIAGENTSNLAKYQERYWHQVGMRILLSDYGSDGTCATSDISSTSGSGTALPELSTNLAASSTTPATPVDLATLAWDVSDTTGNADDGAHAPPYKSGPTWMSAQSPNPIGNTVWPLPTSGSTGAGSYASADGYWVKQYYPIIGGCIKIEYQNSSGVWTDVTPNILELGFTGKDIRPLTATTGTYKWVAPPTLVALQSTGTVIPAQGPTVKSGVTTVSCTDPSTNAVIRLARVRDNPSAGTTTGFNAATTSPCGTPPTTANASTGMHGSDFWPNALFDSREGELVDQTAVTANPTLSGTMYYVELDIGNLAKCLTGTASTFSTYCSWASSVTTSNGEGYSIYFSDRRSEQTDPHPPASVGTTAQLTGGYGFDDVVNASSSAGCPASLASPTLDTGEDLEGDYNTSGVDSSALTVPRTYGNILHPPSPRTAPTVYWPMLQGGTAATAWNLPLTAAGLGTSGMSTVLANNPNCTSLGTAWPFAIVKNSPQELRENPAVFYRRALKITDGYSISIGTAGACNGQNCGLSIAAENLVYVQGDFNNDPRTDATFATPTTDTHVGTAILADSITALSDGWNDANSFISPYSWNGRMAVQTTYRFAMMSGEGVPFQLPSRTIDAGEGTDGGVHNLLRYVENWNTNSSTTFTANSGTAVASYYLGSMVSTYYDHQAVAIWKCCNGSVYQPPQRNYTFDSDFQTSSKLPPLTPMLRDINTIGYTQMMLPTE
jgi:Tfp pilus assembly protein PilX